jgi:aryl-alcohol dehydrogenase-like predicted oxidoreductase
LTEAHLVARRDNLTPPTMEQPEYNMFNRQKVEVDYLPIYELGLGTTIWSPLASGLLTGKYNEGIPADSRINLPGYEWLKRNLESPAGKAKIEKIKKLAVLAKEVGLPVHHMALLWCLNNPRVSTVILGASKKSQLEDNLKALDARAKLTSDVMAKIEEILGNKPDVPVSLSRVS